MTPLSITRVKRTENGHIVNEPRPGDKELPELIERRKDEAERSIPDLGEDERPINTFRALEEDA